MRPRRFPRRQSRADVSQLDAEADGVARRDGSFSRPQLCAAQARDDRRAEENQSLPKIFLVETVLGRDGVSLGDADRPNADRLPARNLRYGHRRFDPRAREMQWPSFYRRNWSVLQV